MSGYGWRPMAAACSTARPNGVVYHTPARLADAGWRVCGHYRFVGDRLAR